MGLFDDLKEGLEEAIAHADGAATGGRSRVVPNVGAIRRRLGLTQADFARVFGISVATLRNWEQGRTQPDGPALTLLRVIDRNPRAVLEALESPADVAHRPE